MITTHTPNSYLNQTVTWYALASTDQFNQPTFTTSEIQVRKEARDRLIKDKFGKTANSTFTIFTNQAVQLGDRIDDLPVLQVYEMINRRGQTVGYEVFT